MPTANPTPQPHVPRLPAHDIVGPCGCRCRREGMRSHRGDETRPIGARDLSRAPVLHRRHFRIPAAAKTAHIQPGAARHHTEGRRRRMAIPCLRNGCSHRRGDGRSNAAGDRKRPVAPWRRSLRHTHAQQSSDRTRRGTRSARRAAGPEGSRADRVGATARCSTTVPRDRWMAPHPSGSTVPLACNAAHPRNLAAPASSARSAYAAWHQHFAPTTTVHPHDGDRRASRALHHPGMLPPSRPNPPL